MSVKYSESVYLVNKILYFRINTYSVSDMAFKRHCIWKFNYTEFTYFCWEWKW